MAMRDITAVGELLIDLTQTGINEQKIPVMAANPGGAPANVAVAAARLGAKTAFVGKVGNDGFGTYLRQVLKDNQVDDQFLQAGDGITTMAIVTVSEDGERSFRFVRGDDRMLTAEEIPESALTETKFFHFGSVSLTAEPARKATLDAVSSARASGALISYDPNYREALWPTVDEAVYWMGKPLDLVDILKISEEELPLLTGTSDLEQGAAMLSRRGISLVLITRGGKGAFCRFRDINFLTEGCPTTVADTNGAGDTFLGAVLSCLCRWDHPLQTMTLEDMKQIVSFANRAASMTCTRSGAIPAMPFLKELEEKRSGNWCSAGSANPGRLQQNRQ